MNAASYIVKAASKSATDEELVSAATQGDTGAFTTLVKRYEDTVFRFSFTVCRDKEKAEETLQDTFVNVYRKLGSFDGRSKFSTWLYSIVTNNCLMKRRRSKMQDALASLDDPGTNEEGALLERIAHWDDTPVERLMNTELRAHLDRAILKLPVDYRVVFVLRDVEGKTTEETAEILKLGKEAVKSRLRRARAFLRNQLAPYMTHVQESEK